MEWGIVEDLKLLELRDEGKSWEYVTGKLDDKGKDLVALKARFNELVLIRAIAINSPEDKEEVKAKKEERKKKKEDAKNEKESGSSGKKGKKKEQSRGGDDGTDSDSVSKKSEKGSTKSSGILKISQKGKHVQTKVTQKEARNEVQVSPGQLEEDARYVGRNGRGEVRFFNGRPVIYKYSGNDIEPLGAEAVSRSGSCDVLTFHVAPS